MVAEADGVTNAIWLCVGSSCLLFTVAAAEMAGGRCRLTLMASLSLSAAVPNGASAAPLLSPL